METPNINPKLAEELNSLFRGHPVQRLNRGLRCLFMDFLITNSEQTGYNELPSYFSDLVYDLAGLMDFLDVAEQEWKEDGVV